jgi:Uma2 family endonuclease
MAVASSRLTLDEFLKLPEEEPALEYVNGVVSQKVSPKGRHSSLQPVIDLSDVLPNFKLTVDDLFASLRAAR